MPGLPLIDWITIGLYMLAMLAIGKYYGRQAKSNEAYLLGNRNLGWRSVGLSLFATLLSTVTYLTMPGEMIQHGPMAFAKILAYPLTVLFVGYWMIPCFMRLQVTSAYEILERRFGLSVRLFGAGIFLVSRLLWMSVIIYLTADSVLIPAMHLNESREVWTPILCLVMGLVTVVYTAEGGIKAVVITDAVQSIMLLGGAVLTLIVVSVSLGGVQPWLSLGWLEHWDKFQLGFEGESRISLLASVLSGFCLTVCLSGSDQMSIQRYLTTRDASSARKVLALSWTTSAVTIVLLAMVGLALLAYVQKNPDFLPNNMNVMDNGDDLFPHFIQFGLPPGVTGLVIAGLLAAAMSSLSSGLNSSCLVIAVDFLQRFGLAPATDTGRVRQTRGLSWVIGVVIVLLSTLVGQIEGNFFELTNKTSNLLIGPSFVLFFMAVFVPWGTALGTWIGTIAAIMAAVAVGYYEVFGLTFIWLLPTSLLVGIVTGCLVSLLPGSKHYEPLELIDA